jgi:hypothetical protein
MLMDFCYDMLMDFYDICVDEIVGHIFLLIDFCDGFVLFLFLKTL